MKLINKLITKTAIYKHLKDLYEQALKMVETERDYAETTRRNYEKIKEKYFSMQAEYNKMQNDLFQLQKFNINPEKYITENKNLYKQIEWLEDCIKKYKKEIYDNYSMEGIVDNIESLIYHNFDDLTNEEIIEEIKEEIKKFPKIRCKSIIIQLSQENENLKINVENKEKQLYKIRTHVNKLDKKDENVKEIKKLIKEML